MISLSPRLQGILDLLEPVDALADIGCDHGYILYEALNKGIIQKGIATDISLPSLRKSETLLKSEFTSNTYECRLGDGLVVVDKKEVSACVIAGMGGILISQILREALDKVKEMDYLILQPMQAEEELFEFLTTFSFELISTGLVCEKNRFYPILKVKIGDSNHRFSWKDFFVEKEFENLAKKNIDRYERIRQGIIKKSKDLSKAEVFEEKKRKWEAYLG